jgi:hypothetical protein
LRAALYVSKLYLPREYAALEQGLIAAGHVVTNNQEADVTVVWNTVSGPASGIILTAENGYLSRGDTYLALAIGGHNGKGIWPAGSAERLARLDITFAPWRTTGNHVLVCASRSFGGQPMPRDWPHTIVGELKRHTKRPIRMRHHPGNWKQLPVHPDVSLAEDLKDAWCCVTWEASAGLKALMWGIPVIYQSSAWIGSLAASSSLADVEHPPMPDRIPAFERVASAQWTLDEIATGKPITALLNLLPSYAFCAAEATTRLSM